MNIRFKGTQYEPTPAIVAAATKKVEGLKKYLAGKDGEADVYVELARAVGAQNTGDIWRTEINLDVAGEQFRAEATKATLEDAIDKAVGEMAREVRRAKRKKTTLFRAGSAKVKEFLQGFGGDR